MAKLDIAAKADLALVLPSLLLASHLNQIGLLPDLDTDFHAAKSLDGGHSVVLTTSGGGAVHDAAVVHYLADIVAQSEAGKKGTKWVDRIDALASKNRRDLEAALADLDKALTLRTYLAGYELGIADLAVWAAVRSNPVAQSLVSKAGGHVLRWYRFTSDAHPWLSALVGDLTAPAANERAHARAQASAAGASYDIDLPGGLTGPFTTRFPPEPSGYLHIGHAKAALLNDYFAHTHGQGGGRLICRFDDTNPSKESAEFQDSIAEDLQSIGIVPDTTSYSSDYFPHMYDLAVQLIRDGKAFADDSKLGKDDGGRKNRLPSRHRDMRVQDTLARFADMKSGSDEGRRWCLRARIAYDSPNGTLRDPVIYRCHVDVPHHRTGTVWKMYPTYDFCAPILDSLEGVTLALRTNEYRDRNVQYAWFQEALGLRPVPIYDFSRMNFVRTVLSKRKLTAIVADRGRVTGWDDPRMPTIRGVLRRGMTVSALREFVLKQGPSRNILNLEWGAFWALNKRHIDPIAARHTAIVAADAVYGTVVGVDGDGSHALGPLTRPKYAKRPELGTKTVVLGTSIVLNQADAQSLAPGEEITLMNWGNAFVRKMATAAREDGTHAVSALDLALHPDGDVKKTKKITWLAATPDNLVPVDLVSFSYLITKDKLEKTDQPSDFLAPVTEFHRPAFADCNVKDLRPGAIIQFEREGYFRLDTAYSKDENARMVFFEIPSR